MLNILLWLIIDLAVMVAAVLFDTYIANGEQGHPAPFMTFIAAVVMGVITVVVIICDIVNCIRSAVRDKQPKDTPQDLLQSAPTSRSATPKKKKPVWRCFIPLMIEIPLTMGFLLWYGSYEINSFYEDPSHIGFAIPIGTIVLALLFAAITVVLLAVCIIVAVNRAKKNKSAVSPEDTIVSNN